MADGSIKCEWNIEMKREVIRFEVLWFECTKFVMVYTILVCSTISSYLFIYHVVQIQTESNRTLQFGSMI